jgi:ADP-ribose pyrophosphatase
MEPWQTLSRRVLLDHSEYLLVEEHAVKLPSGQIIPDWPWIVTPSFVNVVAVTPDERFLCFRQVKYGVKGTTLAPVGGFIDAGEEPLTAAQRELLEETGYEAPTWIDLGRYRVDPNRGIAMAHLFLACDARCTGEPQPDDLEEQELLHLTRAEIEGALAAGQFKVLAWAAIFLLALRYLEN